LSRFENENRCHNKLCRFGTTNFSGYTPFWKQATENMPFFLKQCYLFCKIAKKSIKKKSAIKRVAYTGNKELKGGKLTLCFSCFSSYYS